MKWIQKKNQKRANSNVKLQRMLAFFLVIVMVMTVVPVTGMKVKADTSQIIVNADSTTEVTMYVGDSGQIIPNYIQPTTQEQTTTEMTTEQNDYGYDWNTGWETDWSYDVPKQDTVMNHYVYTAELTDYWYDTTNEVNNYVTLNEDGTFTIRKPGNISISVKGYNAANEVLFSATVNITAKINMQKVTLGKKSATVYLFPEMSWYGTYYASSQVEIPIRSSYVLDSSDSAVTVSSTSSKKAVSVSSEITKNKLILTVDAQKKISTTVSVNICDKTYKVKLNIYPVGISDNGYLLVKGQKKKLKISGYKGKITWKSANKKIATVSKSGVVKGKRIGNVLITAKFQGKKLGCVVSVTSSKVKKVVAYGQYIGKNWKYSQALRTQTGYYDCSALVWKAYKKYAGITFGSSGYPGTTVTESSYLIAHKKMVPGGYSVKNINKMLVNPGDLLFKTSGKKIPANTYHVEMFAGYQCVGFSDDGQPVISTRWANRGSDYAYPDNQLLGRPTK